MPKVKITVVKKMNCNEVFGGNPPAKINHDLLTPECHRFELGQEFFVDLSKDRSHPESWENVPQGFCSWAYADIQRDIAHILFGGSYPWMAEEGATISCCTDGLRPVVFRIERIR
ncbi:MAG: TIGR04076 family protein [Desulfobacteraceae bacterium]|nr:TIGR04076 family protein [Desulfobacteraceae bacterium]